MKYRPGNLDRIYQKCNKIQGLECESDDIFDMNYSSKFLFLKYVNTNVFIICQYTYLLYINTDVQYY